MARSVYDLILYPHPMEMVLTLFSPDVMLMKYLNKIAFKQQTITFGDIFAMHFKMQPRIHGRRRKIIV